MSTANKLLLWILQATNPHKSRGLAWELHRIADLYDPRPTGRWVSK